MAGWFPEDPVETFRRHIWINPFWEDDVHELLELMGPERVIFGSDWPHIEGMPTPLDYLDELDGPGTEGRRPVVRDNTTELNELPPRLSSAAPPAHCSRRPPAHSSAVAPRN